MFLKNSRYRQVPDDVTIDVKRRRLVSKSIRQPPDVTGIFQHTIEDGDRLDHLAYKYYKQPRKWWHICDANPEFMSPQELLGKTPVITQHFPLSFTRPLAKVPSDPPQPPLKGGEKTIYARGLFTDTGSKPRWAELLRDIAALVGVENVLLADNEFVTKYFSLSFIEPDSEPHWEGLIKNIAALVGVENVLLADNKKDLTIAYSQSDTNVEALADTIEKANLTLEQSQTGDRIDQNVIITYNQMTIQEVSILGNVIEQAGKKFHFLDLFVGHPQTIGRTGKGIVIPPNILG